MSRRAILVVALGILAPACGGGNEGSPAPPTAPATPQVPLAWDAEIVRAAPAPGGILWLSAPNETPVDLEVVFSVSVPAGQAGTHNWNTVLQAAHPPGTGWVVPVVTTAFQEVALEVGVQEVTVTGFKTTNAVCYNLASTPAATQSLDIDVRAPGAPIGQRQPQVMGKQLEATWELRCR
jgi:hypothetical protein